MSVIDIWPAWIANRRLIPLFALLAAVILLTAGVAVAVYDEEIYRVEKLDETDVQAKILAGSVAAALIFDDRKAAGEYVDALKVNPEVEAAAVYGTSGGVFAGFVRPGARPLPVRARLRQAAYAHDRLTVTAPVEQNGTMAGAVYLRMIGEPLSRRLARYAGILLLGIMGAIVLTVLGTSQAALTRANVALASRARDLEEANHRLHDEMTERAKAEEQLRQSQKMEAIGQLSGGIAHDFNNLLMIIKGNLQLMERRIAQGRTDFGRYLQAASEGLNRAASLTQRILAFSRRQPLSPKPVDISALIVEMGDLLRNSVGESVAIEIQLGAKGWTLCDANQMENVILNLAINSRDAMPHGGRLTLETGDMAVGPAQAAAYEIAPGDYVRLTVTDTGTGMSEGVRGKAVDPFFTTKPPGQGTGLGLSMTFGYIRQSGGYFAIESEVGKGTTITILMPCTDQSEIPEKANGTDGRV